MRNKSVKRQREMAREWSDFISQCVLPISPDIFANDPNNGQPGSAFFSFSSRGVAMAICVIATWTSRIRASPCDTLARNAGRWKLGAPGRSSRSAAWHARAPEVGQRVKRGAGCPPISSCARIRITRARRVLPPDILEGGVPRTNELPEDEIIRARNVDAFRSFDSDGRSARKAISISLSLGLGFSRIRPVQRSKFAGKWIRSIRPNPLRDSNPDSGEEHLSAS